MCSRSIFDTAGGNIVRVKCGGNDLTVTYFHLAEYFIPKGSIAKIIAGQPIGVMGSTGAYTTGAHMHYGIQKGCMAYSEACTIDPEPFIYKKITIN